MKDTYRGNLGFTINKGKIYTEENPGFGIEQSHTLRKIKGLASKERNIQRKSRVQHQKKDISEENQSFSAKMVYIPYSLQSRVQHGNGY
jgi:hypothetical protein